MSAGWRAIAWGAAAAVIVGLPWPLMAVAALWCAYKAGQNVQQYENARTVRAPKDRRERRRVQRMRTHPCREWRTIHVDEHTFIEECVGCGRQRARVYRCD